MKASLLADFKDTDIAKLRRPEAFLEATNFETMLVAKEASVPVARQRNRNLVAAKTLILTDLLRDGKTQELKALAIRIEQVILDLSHEAEMETERAQRTVESGSGNNVDRNREFAVLYKERIEVLKPVLAAIKEEIANRGK
jgi:hypothetical protein